MIHPEETKPDWEESHPSPVFTSRVCWPGLAPWLSAVAQLTLEIVSSSSFPALLVSSNFPGHMMQEVDHTRDVKFINN